MSNSNAHSSQISDQNEALRRENADLYAQIKALSQRLAQGSAGEFPPWHVCTVVLRAREPGPRSLAPGESCIGGQRRGASRQVERVLASC